MGTSLVDPHSSNESSALSREDLNSIRRIRLMDYHHDMDQPFVSAPVCFNLQRTYNPAILMPNPVGDYIPSPMARQISCYMYANWIEGFGRYLQAMH